MMTEAAALPKFVPAAVHANQRPWNETCRLSYPTRFATASSETKVVLTLVGAEIQGTSTRRPDPRPGRLLYKEE